MSKVNQEKCVCGVLMGKHVDDWSLGKSRLPASQQVDINDTELIIECEMH